MSKLQAYYYGFDSTENEEVDAILEAVANAGHASHHTDSWQEGKPGETLVDAIQAAAVKTAETIRALEFERDVWRGKVLMRDKIANGLPLDPA